jgi:hypothetical protein
MFPVVHSPISFVDATCWATGPALPAPPILVAGGFHGEQGENPGVFNWFASQADAEPAFWNQQDTLAAIFPPEVDDNSLSAEAFLDPANWAFLGVEVGSITIAFPVQQTSEEHPETLVEQIETSEPSPSICSSISDIPVLPIEFDQSPIASPLRVTDSATTIDFNNWERSQTLRYSVDFPQHMRSDNPVLESRSELRHWETSSMSWPNSELGLNQFASCDLAEVAC